MPYVVSGLPLEPFQSLFGLSDAALAERGVIRCKASSKPGFPCRITLEDAEPGDSLLLLNHESHSAATPYRSSYAIYVNENARARARSIDALPPVMRNRPIALRIFNAEGMLIGADLARDADLDAAIRRAFDSQQAAYIHARNAAYGCYSAQIERN